MTVELMPPAAEELAVLPRVIRQRVTVLIERLERWPEVSGAKPLRGKLAGHWRMRTGDYRVQFVIRGQVVIVGKIAHRDRFYEE